MPRPQPGILAPLPPHARYVWFDLLPGAEPEVARASLASLPVDGSCVAGLGPSLVAALGAEIPQLRPFPALSGPGFDVPATPCALWLWLRGDDRGELVHLQRDLEDQLGDAFEVESVVDGFVFRGGRDLTGYEDGTENPTGDQAAEVAFAEDGSSVVAVQRWEHDLDAFQDHPVPDQDRIIGRRISDNTELRDAPDSAHVQRTEQDNFEPPAFLLRRSMPWADGEGEGLVFVAFEHDGTAFERILRRMVGLDDGVPDALFRFTRPVTGATFWCPPVLDDELDLSALG